MKRACYVIAVILLSAASIALVLRRAPPVWVVTPLVVMIYLTLGFSRDSGSTA